MWLMVFRMRNLVHPFLLMYIHILPWSWLPQQPSNWCRLLTVRVKTIVLCFVLGSGDVIYSWECCHWFLVMDRPFSVNLNTLSGCFCLKEESLIWSVNPRFLMNQMGFRISMELFPCPVGWLDWGFSLLLGWASNNHLGLDWTISCLWGISDMHGSQRTSWFSENTRRWNQHQTSLEHCWNKICNECNQAQ